MKLTRGMREKLNTYFNINTPLDIVLAIKGNSIYDFCCFGVDSNNKLSDDRYMIFYNQKSSPHGEISFSSNNNSANFSVDLSKIPTTICKLVFTVSIDGNGTMGDITEHSFSLFQENREALTLHLLGSDFKSEKAIISFELYLKNEWRISAVANGFNGGLSTLLAHFGGTEISNSNIQAQPKVSTPNTLSQNINTVTEEKTPKKISLKKGEKVSLLKNANMPIIIENGWTATGKDYDLKALIRYRNGKLIYIGAANRDELLCSPEGAIKHGGDVKNPGELEHIEINWHKDIASVAVSSYSAIENGTGSFHSYGVFVRIKNGKQIIEIPAQNASADDRSYTLCFGEIIFGTTPNEFDISALELYSKPNSENRIGYRNGTVVMDIGPVGKTK